MKTIFKNLHRRTKYIVVFSWSAVVTLLFASTLFYIGAGRMFDYHFAVDLSETLLTLCRPASISACLASVFSEHYARQQSL
jgi:hypothetical protein